VVCVFAGLAVLKYEYSSGAGHSMIPVPVIGRCVRLVGNGG